MNLPDARELKGQVCKKLDGTPLRRRFAAGITLGAAPDDCRVAILLHSERDRRLLKSGRIAAFLHAFRGDVEVGCIGDVARSSGTADGGASSLPFGIGASIGHFTGGDGSAGFFAVERSTGRRGVVSCNHAIAYADRGVDGDAVISPSASNGGSVPAHRVASLAGGYPRLDGDAPRADCAFAVVAKGVAYDPGAVEGGRLSPMTATAVVRLGVTKIGWATGAREGVVVGIEIDDVPVRYDDVKVSFNGVMQIGSISERPFAAYGDSGALVYTTDGRHPVGLLFAASRFGGPQNAGWAWAHPIDVVTEVLDVDLVVT